MGRFIQSRCRRCHAKFTPSQRRHGWVYCRACSNESSVRRERAKTDLPEVKARAAGFGISVGPLDPRFVGVRFEHADWTVDVWPGTFSRRVISGTAPDLSALPEEWVLGDVLDALTDPDYAERALELAASAAGLAPA